MKSLEQILSRLPVSIEREYRWRELYENHSTNTKYIISENKTLGRGALSKMKALYLHF